jgi:murein DD-endopeptidase MepM/ murein hydrolase activator NlpD
MSQKLILPVSKAKLTASWKTQAYEKRFGFVHYGVDLVSAERIRNLYASGDGVVLETGVDSVVGNVVVIQYLDAVRRSTGKSMDVVFRYFHLDSVKVKPGDKVNKDVCFAVYGNTGSLKMDFHLHMEADTDCDHARYSPTVNNSSFLRGRAHGATDATMTNPMDWLHCKTSPPDNQTYATADNMFIAPEDTAIGAI